MALFGFSIPRLSIQSLAQFFLVATIFTLPWRIRSLVYASSAYEVGFFNEYAAYFVYLSEIFLLLAIFFTGLLFVTQRTVSSLQLQTLKKYLWPVLVLLALSVVALPFANDSFLALLFFWRTLALVALMLLLGVGLLSRSALIKVTVITLFFQAILGVGQYFAGGSLGFALFGESIANETTFNVAKVLLPDGTVALRALGTLAHANILGGLLALGLLFAAALPRKNILAYFTIIILEVGLFFTFSRAAYLAFFLGLLILLILEFRRRLISAFLATALFAVLVSVFGSPFFVRFGEVSNAPTRLTQLELATQMIYENPLGVGRGSYVAALSKIQPDLQPYQLQPVHNFFALKAAEEGMVVALAWLVFFGTFVYWTWHEKKFTALAVLMATFVLAQFDHYLADSFAGEALLFVAFGFTLAELTQPSLEFAKRTLKPAIQK